MYGRYEIRRKTDSGYEVIAQSYAVELSGQWMDKCRLTADIKSRTPITFAIGDYIEYLGERYTLNHLPGLTKNSNGVDNGAYEYKSVRFDNCSYELERCMVLDADAVTSADGNAYYSSPQFTLHCNTVKDFVEKLILNLDRIYGKGTWRMKINEDTESATNVDVEISNNTVWECLSMVSKKFKTSFYVRELSEPLSDSEPAGKYIFIGDETSLNQTALEYGKGKGLRQIERSVNNDEKTVTRLRAYGSEDNMPTNYYSEMYEPWLKCKFRLYIGEPLNTSENFFLPETLPEDPGVFDGFYIASVPRLDANDELQSVWNVTSINGKSANLYSASDTDLSDGYRYPILIPITCTDNSDGHTCTITVIEDVDGKNVTTEYEAKIHKANMYDFFGEDTSGEFSSFSGSGLFMQKEAFKDFCLKLFEFDQSPISSLYRVPSALKGHVQYILVKHGFSTLQLFSKKSLLTAEKILAPLGAGVNRLMLPWFTWLKAFKLEDGTYTPCALDQSRYKSDGAGHYTLEKGGDGELFYLSDGETSYSEGEIICDVYYNDGIDDSRINEGIVVFRESAMEKQYGITEGIVMYEDEDDGGKVSPTLQGITQANLTDAGYEAIVPKYDNGNMDEILHCTTPDDDGIVYKNSEGTATALTSYFILYYKDMGFSIRDYATESDAAIQMTSGDCSGRSFSIKYGQIEPRVTYIAIRSIGADYGGKSYAIKRNVMCLPEAYNSQLDQPIEFTVDTLTGDYALASTVISVDQYTCPISGETKSPLEWIASGEYELVRCYRAMLTREADSTLGLYFPNRTSGCRIQGELRTMMRYGDTYSEMYHSDMFVFENITMPSAYINAWSYRLLEAAKETYWNGINDNVEFRLDADPIYMQREYDAAEDKTKSLKYTLKEGKRITVTDADADPEGRLTNERWYIKSFSIKESESQIPQYSVTIAKDVELTSLQKMQGQIVVMKTKIVNQSTTGNTGTQTRIISNSTVIRGSETKVVDNLESDEKLAALSARQGKELKALIYEEQERRHTNIPAVDQANETQSSYAGDKTVTITLNRQAGHLLAVEDSTLKPLVPTGYNNWEADYDTQNGLSATDYLRKGDCIYADGEIWECDGSRWHRMDNSGLSEEIDAMKDDINRLAAGSDVHYIHTQSALTEEWAISHNLGKRPAVTVLDTDGNEVECDIRHEDTNNVTLKFGKPFAGTAILN